MVFINITAVFLLCFGIFFYKFIYPKKNVNLFLILILVSLLPLISLLRPGTFESGDFNIHIYRIMSFYDSLREGNIFPSWAAELNATYGNPLFIFNYSLPYYIVSFFHFLGFSFVSGMKLFLGLSFMSSGVFMYLWIIKLTNNKLAAFTAGIFYLFNPYHLVDLSFRATLGELSVFAMAPLVFLFLTECARQKNVYFLLLTSISTALLFASHPLLAVTILGIAILFVILMRLINRDNISLLYGLGSLVIGVAASSYLWVSFLLYAPYTFGNPTSNLSFIPFHLLFYSPWRFGFLFQGHRGELALIVGYMQMFIVFATIFILIKSKIFKKIYANCLFWIFLFVIFIFLMHPSSIIIWKFFPIFWMFIPFGRLLLPTALTTSVIAGYFVVIFLHPRTRRKVIFIYILLIITAGSTILNWSHRRVIPEIGDSILRKNVWISTVYEGKTAYFLNTKWADVNNFWFSKKPKSHLQIIQGKGTFKQIKRTSTQHIYIVNAQTPLTILENTLYFPGWVLRSNNKVISIYPDEKGIISTKLPQGLLYLELTYDDSGPYKLSKIISLGIFLSLLLLLLLYTFPWKIKKNKVFL